MLVMFVDKIIFKRLGGVFGLENCEYLKKVVFVFQVKNGI